MYCLLFLNSVLQLTTWSRVLTEKLTVAHNKPEILQLAYILEVYWCIHKTIQLVPLFNQMNLNSIPTASFFNLLILSSHLCLRLPSGYLPIRFFNQSCSLSSHLCVLHAASHSPAFAYLIVILGCGLQDRGIMVLISGRDRILSLFQNVQTSSGVLSASYSLGAGSSFFWSKVVVEWSCTPVSSAKVKNA